MCVTIANAELTNTVIYAGQMLHPKTGRLIHTLGYQNTASSSSGPNAMLLHIPSALPIGKENMLEVPSNCLKDMASADDGGRGSSLQSKDFLEFFDCGMYTVIVTNQPTLASEALKQVPVEKRPNFIKLELLQWYENHFQGWPLAICCFQNQENEEMDPIFFWYEPIDSSKLFLPGIDCHTGNIPKKEPVNRDHTLIWSSEELIKQGTGQDVFYTQKLQSPTEDFLPAQVIKRTLLNTLTPNGDFYISIQDVGRAESRNWEVKFSN